MRDKLVARLSKASVQFEDSDFEVDPLEIDSVAKKEVENFLLQLGRESSPKDSEIFRNTPTRNLNP